MMSSKLCLGLCIAPSLVTSLRVTPTNSPNQGPLLELEEEFPAPAGYHRGGQFRVGHDAPYISFDRSASLLDIPFMDLDDSGAESFGPEAHAHVDFTEEGNALQGNFLRSDFRSTENGSDGQDEKIDRPNSAMRASAASTRATGSSPRPEPMEDPASVHEEYSEETSLVRAPQPRRLTDVSSIIFQELENDQ